MIHKGLVCNVTAMRYFFDRKEGQLFLADGCCCDMNGCIELFKSIDPSVKSIQTFSGIRRDTLYKKEGKTWSSYTWPPSKVKITRNPESRDDIIR